MHKTTFAVDAATEQDIPALLLLIKQLAAYEKLAHEVVATEDSLKAALFGPEANVEALVVRVDQRAVGLALYFHNFSTFTGKRGLYLEDLFVLEKFRGQGMGLALFQRLAKIAEDRGCARFEWSVLDWNTPAIDFYTNLGAKPMTGWTVFRLSGEALTALARTR